MKKAALALSTLCALNAFAFAGPEKFSGKEMKQVAPTPVPEPCNWEGFYLGLNAGGTFANSTTTEGETTVIAPLQLFGGLDWSHDASGFVGGIEGGYNWQPLRHLVLGFEADAGYLGLDGDGQTSGASFLLLHPVTGETNDGFYGTFRGRVGFAIEKFLFYATGGGIVANNEVRVSNHNNIDQSANADGSSDDFRLGWTVGGGAAYAINCHWSVKLEYLYYNLESEGIHTVDSNEDLAEITSWNVKTDGHIVRAGLDFKF